MGDNSAIECYPDTWAVKLDPFIELCKPHLGKMCVDCVWDQIKTREAFLNQIEESVKYE